MYQDTPTTTARQRRADYDAGWQMYADLLDRRHCTNEWQRKGWDAALNAHAYAETAEWIEAHREAVYA